MGKFNFGIFLDQIYQENMFEPDDVRGKNILIIGDAQTMKNGAFVLKERLDKLGAGTSFVMPLFNARTMESYVSIHDLCVSVGTGSYDMVILLGGLEKEKDFLQAANDLQEICKMNGKIIVLARTPYETGTALCLDYYEDDWRYEPKDIAHMFIQCRVEKAFLSEPAYVFALRFEKRRKSFQQLEETKPSLYNCRARSRISMQDAKALGFFRQYQNLDEIGIQYHTDKCRFDHNYLDKYEFFLSSWRQDCFNLLELGVFIGSSEFMWEKYFPHAQIYGVDINPDCQRYASKRIHILQADLSQVEALEGLKEIHPRLIVDDASHICSHQILALFVLFDVLPSGGVYILEDLETSVNPELFQGADDTEISAYEVCSRIARVVAGKNAYTEGPFANEITYIGMRTEMISIIKGSCILIKR